jgi:hypothetical protein
VTIWVGEAAAGVELGCEMLGAEVGDGRWVEGVAAGAALQPARTSAIATTEPIRRARRLSRITDLR